MRRFLLILLLLGIALPLAALEIPKPQGYVNDLAGILSAPAKAKIETFLREFEQSDSTQLVVVTLPSLEGQPVESVALKIAEEWKIGQKGKDNGALLLIAKEERKMRIEVGMGLEGRLTDLLAGRIVDNEIAPRFKKGDFDGGIAAGVSAMAQAVRGEYKGTGRVNGRKGKNAGLWWVFPLVFFVLPLFSRAAFSGNGRGRHGGGFWIGGPGGFGGGGGGGFGGFSGGGGGFSGGGSSGSW